MKLDLPEPSADHNMTADGQVTCDPLADQLYDPPGRMTDLLTDYLDGRHPHHLDNGIIDVEDGPILTSTPIPPRAEDAPHPTQRITKTGWPRPQALEIAYPDMAKLYTAVATHSRPNSMAARIPIPSRLNVDHWYAIATGHPHDTVVLDGVTFGFNLQYTGPPLPTEGHIENH